MVNNDGTKTDWCVVSSGREVDFRRRRNREMSVEDFKHLGFYIYELFSWYQGAQALSMSSTEQHIEDLNIKHSSLGFRKFFLATVEFVLLYGHRPWRRPWLAVTPVCCVQYSMPLARSCAQSQTTLQFLINWSDAYWFLGFCPTPGAYFGPPVYWFLKNLKEPLQ